MNAASWAQPILMTALLLLLARPLAAWLVRVWKDDLPAWTRPLQRAEAAVLRLAGVRGDVEMTWTAYATALLALHGVSVLTLYAMLRFQAVLPWNPAGVPGMDPGVAFNTAVSFVTNTNWQAYSGEVALSPLSQAVGLTTQNFVSAAVGLAVLVALLRGLHCTESATIGNVWRDLWRATAYVLLPLSLVWAVLLGAAGVPQSTAVEARGQLIDPIEVPADAPPGTAPVTEQVIAIGPVASQVAIKQLGTNGGGYYGVNSAHPLENPSPWTNLLQWLALLLLPVAQCLAMGPMIGDARQGKALLAAMAVVALPVLALTMYAELQAPPWLADLGVAVQSDNGSAIGNLEGKEVRFGPVLSALWAVATTAASNGSVNAMHDSFLPLGGLGPMLLIQLGEIVFGGVGSGLYGMLAFVVLAVFIAGLLVGRTPEYVGKKIEPFDVKAAALAVLLPAITVLLGTAAACLQPSVLAAMGNPGAQGFSEVLYAFSSAANNNGSALGGLVASGPVLAYSMGIAMWIGRFCVIVPILALAGSMARKRRVPASAGTLPTHDGLFVTLLVGTIVLVGALTFLPALALGPIVEHLRLFAS